MSERGRDCPTGDKCHWIGLQIPREPGKGIGYFQCKKCKFIKHEEVTVE